MGFFSQKFAKVVIKMNYTITNKLILNLNIKYTASLDSQRNPILSMEITRYYKLNIYTCKILVVDINCSLLWQGVTQLKGNRSLIKDLILHELLQIIREIELTSLNDIDKVNLNLCELRYSLQIWNNLLYSIQSRENLTAQYVITEQSSTDREDYLSKSKILQNWKIGLSSLIETSYERIESDTSKEDDEVLEEDDDDEILIKFMLMQIFEELNIDESDFESILNRYKSMGELVSNLS